MAAALANLLREIAGVLDDRETVAGTGCGRRGRVAGGDHQNDTRDSDNDGSADGNNNRRAIVLAISGFSSGVVEVVGFHYTGKATAGRAALTIAQL
jgi:hypothetical protein